MLISSILLFMLFLALSAFFAASETALISANPFSIDNLASKGSRRADLVRKARARIEHLLAAILIGNTLVNIAAASVSTIVFVSLLRDRNQAALLATITTTILVLIFGEINPKTFAAHNPVRYSLWAIQSIRWFMIIFYPIIKTVTIISKLLVPVNRNRTTGRATVLNEEEIKLLLTTGVPGLSSIRKKMINSILEIGSRPVKEIMIPRPRIRAIDIDAGFRQILEIIVSAEYSRYPVYRGRLDNIEGLIHTKDVAPFLVDNKEFNIQSILRKPVFIPESASLENVLLQMQENAVHMAFVVDEFGSLEGIITLEDLIEEIVGEIRDEYDDKIEEEWLHHEGGSVYLIKGHAPVKEISQKLPIEFHEKGQYTTLAGFLLDKFGRIPHEKDVLDDAGHRFIVEKMTGRRISLVRVLLDERSKKESSDEDRRRQ